MILAGGFPIALARPTAESRRRWFRDFVEMVIERDVLEIRRVCQRVVLPQILRRLAAHSAQLLSPAAVASTIELDKSTVNDFIRLLESVFLVHRLGALWPHAVLPCHPFTEGALGRQRARCIPTGNH